ncbi:hypothetical protein, partial [Pseudomonas aeruginosa]|uniref:hypothetical protein n=1 Tax=Pseudomonas aeruginosa TaxID=287 RepID=UPI001ABC4F99
MNSFVIPAPSPFVRADSFSPCMTCHYIAGIIHGRFPPRMETIWTYMELLAQVGSGVKSFHWQT